MWIEILIEQAIVLYCKAVTPFTGVWIEINVNNAKDTPRHVTPFTGVWIEIGEQ